MRKNYLLSLLLLVTATGAISQSISFKKDSLKIDSIKKILPKLKSVNRIESMIFLCEYYSDRLKDNNAADSFHFYGNRILKESKSINYIRGIAMGELASAADSLKEKNARKAMQIGKDIGDEEIMG